ncbi:MAG: cytochrome d ubiquinol oxidase subunit II, partial [Sphingomonas sp.]
ACWLIAKTEGTAQRHAYRLARRYGVMTVIAIIAVSAATPFLSHDYYSRWFAMPGIILTAPVPILIGGLSFLFWRALSRKAEAAPFVLVLALFALCFVGLGISMYPFIVPNGITIWAAAAPRNSQVFMLVGAGVMIPVILGYTGWSYWIFRGKVGAGYH